MLVYEGEGEATLSFSVLAPCSVRSAFKGKEFAPVGTDQFFPFTLLHLDGVLAVLSAIGLKVDPVLEGESKQEITRVVCFCKNDGNILSLISTHGQVGCLPLFALRMAKTLWSFGHSACNRVK